MSFGQNTLQVVEIKKLQHNILWSGEKAEKFACFSVNTPFRPLDGGSAPKMALVARE
jgi:hypothetical protein